MHCAFLFSTILIQNIAFEAPRYTYVIKEGGEKCVCLCVCVCVCVGMRTWACVCVHVLFYLSWGRLHPDMKGRGGSKAATVAEERELEKVVVWR